MKALVTGTSKGLGLEMALHLISIGIHTFVVSRNVDLLNLHFKGKNATIISLDLAKEQNATYLYDKLKCRDIDIVINNAGIGNFGFFDETSLEKDIDMININIKTLHILTKLFLKDMVSRNSGYILNVCSIGAFLNTPFLASYYATKSYILNITLGINYELKLKKSNVYLGVFCPQTINTDFHKNSGISSFANIGLSSTYCAIYSINKMFERKIVIIPKYANLIPYITRFVPKNLILKTLYLVQHKKLSTKI